MSPNVKKTTTNLTKHNKKVADAWWSTDVGTTHNIDTQKTRLNRLPNNIGFMKLFNSPITMKLSDAELMSVVDENNKLCISLTDEQYSFLESIQDAMNNKLVKQIKGMDDNYAESEFMSTVRVSDATDKKYLKTKVQLLGATRTMGIDVMGNHVTNPAAALSTAGTQFDVRIRIDGVYVTKTNAGIMTKVDLFRVKEVPDEAALEEAREAKRVKFEGERMNSLSSF